MIISSTRRIAARIMPLGLSEQVATEIRKTFDSPLATSSPGAIDGIIRCATSTVPFYRRRGSEALNELPVVDKSMMVTDPTDFLAADADPLRLHSRKSSGSSGIPFTSYSDDQRITRHRAELVGGYSYLGADPFGSFVHCRPWFNAGKRERLSYALRGQYLYSGEQDEESVRTVARWINHRRRTTIIGLCSFLEILLRSFETYGISVPAGKVGVVLGVGEPASRYLTEATPRLFGVDLSRRYSNTENGILGFARHGDSQYKLDTSTFHVEILEQTSDDPAPPGTIGRVVVTDLHNRAMPFLRYDTGDLGRFSLTSDGKPVPNVLADLTGRRSDVPIAGTEAQPVRATYYKLFMRVDTNPELRQFQLRQHAIGRFTWILNAERSTSLEERIRRLMDEEIGDILSCDFQYVSDIRLAQSGKRRFFINEIPESESQLDSPSE